MAEPMTDAGVVVRSAGGPEVLEWTALETAKPGRGEVRIEQRKFSDLASGGSLFATRPMLFDYIKSREDLSSRAADLFAFEPAKDWKAGRIRRSCCRPSRWMNCAGLPIARPSFPRLAPPAPTTR